MNRTRAKTTPTALIAALALGISASALEGQSTLLDQGAFQISLNGRPAGTESFTIERSGTGVDAMIVARGNVEFNGRRANTLLEATEGTGFSAYRAEMSGAESSEVVVTRRQRLGVWVRSPAGVQDREVRWREGSVLLDDLVAHHYYFLGMVAPGAAAPVILPLGNDQALLQVVAVESVTLAVEGGPLEARRLTLTVDAQERFVWVDALGRVLRVEVPSAGYVAERLRPPPQLARGRLE